MVDKQIFLRYYTFALPIAVVLIMVEEAFVSGSYLNTQLFDLLQIDNMENFYFFSGGPPSKNDGYKKRKGGLRGVSYYK